MSRFSPSVLPEYQGGDPASVIAQAFQQRDALRRQKNLDAVQTGIGLEDDATAPADNRSPIARALQGAWSKISGHEAGPTGEQSAWAQRQQPAQSQFVAALSGQTGQDAASVYRGMPSNVPPPTPFNPRASVGGPWQEHGPNASPVARNAALGTPGVYTTPGANPTASPTGGAGSVSSGQAVAPGSFNAMSGGFMPVLPKTFRLPDGSTVESRFTPMGERLEERNAQIESNMLTRQMMANSMLQRTGMQQEGADQRNVNTVSGSLTRAGMSSETSRANTDERVKASVGNNERTNQTRTTIHNTPGATKVADNAPHVLVGLNGEIAQTNRDEAAARRVLDAGPGVSHDDSAAYSQAKGVIANARLERAALLAQHKKVLAGMMGGGGDATGGSPAGAPKVDGATRVQQLHAQGMSSAAIKAQLQKEGYAVK